MVIGSVQHIVIMSTDAKQLILFFCTSLNDKFLFLKLMVLSDDEECIVG